MAPIAKQSRLLTALPVFNEVEHVETVLNEVLKFTNDVLVVDDGSTDGTFDLLLGRSDIQLIRHDSNLGYGAALHTAFKASLDGPWDGLVTIDCDGQHQPQMIPQFIAAVSKGKADIVSGSRYLKHFPGDSTPPASRRQVNAEITHEINVRFGLALTDAFCGFKAYSRWALEHLRVSETGYAMPLEIWVQAATAHLQIVEIPVPLVYLDMTRSFGGALDDAVTRLAYYRTVLDRAELAVATQTSATTE
ncbi:MAG: glycosyltransferase family 2 protein [Pirellulales bacterium]